MKRFAILAALVVAGFAATSTAEAHPRSARGYGHYGHNHGWGGYTQRWGGGYGGGYGIGYPGYRPPVYHDTSHYDYHPTTVVPHGNHYHVIPGHYHFHQQGHWHY